MCGIAVPAVLRAGFPAYPTVNLINHLGLLYIKAKAKIIKRIERIELGNLGDYKSVGKGICELRLDYSAGHRIYFGQLGNVIVIILCGGNKSTQDKDIIEAQEYWKNYRRS